MRKKNLKYTIFLCISLLLNSCYYKPFIGYTLNNKGFKHFSRKEKVAGNNSNPHRDYHINKYDWNVEVFPDKKRISGKMIIYFTSNSKQNKFLFDLQKKMRITSFSCSSKKAKIKRKNDLIYLVLEESITPKTRIQLTINYEGKPANVAGYGPIKWKLDKKNRHWISTVTEGIGPQFIMPCNALLNAEADSCNIRITVPNELIAVANGRLKKIIKNDNSITYNYEVTNPINTYSISFNIGHFKKMIKPYTDINGEKRKIECQVLDYNYDIANKFYEQAPKIMHEFETLFGEFPWWGDGCKFIESNFTAMEHQSGIAMGSNYKTYWKGYNLTLVHELSHEWWGNSLTGRDYCDIWIHEGLASYSEALFLERLFGKDDYEKKISHYAYTTKNTIPIHKECDVLYNSWVNNADQDIYYKGALMIHSLRKVVNNDSLFFNSLLTIQKEFKKQNISTKKLTLKFNELLKQDFSSLFNWYLYRIKPPTLQIVIDKENNKLYYKWEKEIPFYIEGQIILKKGSELISLTPTKIYQSCSLDKFHLSNFLIEKSIYYVVDVQKKK